MKTTRIHDSRCIDYAAAKHGEQMLYNALCGFVSGIRGERHSPVSLKQIKAWFNGTDAAFVEHVLDKAIADGRVRTVRNSLRYGNNHRQAMYYEISESE